MNKKSDRSLILLVTILAALPAVGGSIIRGQWGEALIYATFGGIALVVVFVGMEDQKQLPAHLRSEHHR